MPTNSARINLNRNPWIFGEEVFTSFIVTYVSIRTSDTSRIPHGYPSQLTERSATSCNFRKNYKSTIRYMILAPLHLRRRNSIRPVSCYAIFKGWLLLNQPPAVKEFPHPFTLNHNLGTLSGGLGSFLSTMDLSTHSLSAEEQHLAFGVLLGLVRISSPYI